MKDEITKITKNKVNRKYAGNSGYEESSKVDEFLKDIFKVYEKHDMAISHEDCHGSFIIVKNNPVEIDWMWSAMDKTERRAHTRREPEPIMNTSDANQKTSESPSCGAACSLSFEDWWNDQENGCPTLVLDNDEQFARAVWNAAIKSIEKCNEKYTTC